MWKMILIKGISILVILGLVVISLVFSICAKKEKTQEELRREIKPYLKEIEKTCKSTEPLIKGLQYPKICSNLQKIAEKNKPQIIPILIEIIKDKKLYWEVRYDIAKILGCIGSFEIIPDLTEMLKDEDKITIRSAVRSLCYSRNEKAIELLSMELKNKKLRDTILWEMSFNATEENLKKWGKNENLKKVLGEISKKEKIDYLGLAKRLLEDINKNRKRWL